MGYLKKRTGAIITAVKDQSLRTYYIKHAIDKQIVSLKYRICLKKDESTMYTASGCDGLAKDQYKVMMLPEK